MQKKTHTKRVLAFVLAAVLGLLNALPGAGVMPVQAASVYENKNYLVNPDFEEATPFSPAGGSHAGNWFYWQSVAKTTDEAQSGSASVKLSGDEAALEQDVPGLQIGMTYVFTVWAKLSAEGNTSANHMVGVKNYGGEEIKRKVTSTDWEKMEIEFTYTGETPRVYGYTATRGNADMYIDHASLTAKSDIQKAEITNGNLEVTFQDGSVVTPQDFTATYCSDVDADTVKELELTAGTMENNVLPLHFAAIGELPVKQTITVNLTYKGQTITLDFVVEASGEAVVTAGIASVNVQNGEVSVVLDNNPTVVPVKGDFTWEYSINGGEYKTLNTDSFVYDSQNKTAKVSFDEIRGIPDAVQDVTIKVTYQNGTPVESGFEVPAGTSKVFYVDSTSGNDANDGTTPETAFQTIDKLNTMTFLPGDKILFKKGETFRGCFKPQGSGSEGAPITIASYGDGEDRPVLQPGKDWTVPYVMSAGAKVNNPKVNYVIQFYNVEYWEVSGLEIMDPNSKAYLTKGSGLYIGNSANDVYRSGITIQGEDIGTLEHFYVDDVIIHGFHGPGTNIGKTSGGITMNVITNGERNRALSVPTQINDIHITNCEIYDVGRSGINFLTPWSFRTDKKWGPFSYGVRGYEYFPYEGFYMANNYIHDVDGDGTIIDNCSGAISEYNLVTRCCLRPSTEGGGAAVGLFNWNSDDTTFQFNEVYDIRSGAGARASNDGQGIEIDALNDRTWVQYNYVHDNAGGFMMLCNVADSYRSFDGIIRYNISQNDHAHPRQGLFDIYDANYGTEIYNNTFYLTEKALKPNSDQIFLFSAVGAYETMKFYNNIFYYDGATPAAANTFGDGAIDWQSNIFYGFTNLPKDDNADAPNMDTDPELEAIGTGGTGKYPGDPVDLSCYYTTADSPAINAGVPVENNGGRDYFGNPLTSIPDIGAYESGSVGLRILSNTYEVDQDEKTITVDANGKVTAEKLLASLTYEEGLTVTLKRGSSSLSGGVRLADGDTVTASYNDNAVTYTMKLVTGEENRVIPVEDMLVSAVAAETVHSNDKVENVIDGNVKTIWHTPWDTKLAAEDRYLTIELKNDYEVSGYVYTPRSDAGNGGFNGVITKYEIYVSNDQANWTKAAEGDWAKDASVKTAVFDPVQAKYIKLLALESHGGHVSAAEVRLTGERIYSDTEAPSTPNATLEEVTKTTAVINWTKSTDNVGVAEYRLLNGETVIASFDGGEETYVYGVADLMEDTEYTFSVVAVDEAGNVSEAGSVAFRTDKSGAGVLMPDKTELQKVYDEYAEIRNQNYTEESWKEFEAALATAKAVLDKEDASQEEVQTALESLSKAKEALAPGEDEKPGTDKPGSGDRPGTDKPGSGDRPGTDKPGSGEKPGTGNSGSGEKPGMSASGSNTTAGAGKSDSNVKSETNHSSSNVKAGTGSTSKSPATGDVADYAFYVILIVTACVSIGIVVRRKLRG